MKTNKPSTIVLVIALTQFAMPYMFSGVGIALPSLGKDLNAGSVTLGLIETVYIGSSAALLLPFGRLADMTDKKGVFKVGLLIFTLSTMVIGFSTSIWQILFFRFIQGASTAMVTATNMAIITEVVDKDKLGKAFGISIGSVYAGLSSGPFFAGIITTHFGWRWVFFSGSILLLISYFVVFKMLEGKLRLKGVRLDLYGSLSIITAVALLISGSSTLEHGYLGFILFFCSILMFTVFFIVENKVKNPLINIKFFFENKNFTNALLLQYSNYASTFAIPFLFSLYLQNSKGLPPEKAGTFLMVSPVIMAILAPVFGRIADTRSPQKIARAGLVLCFAATIMASQVSKGTSMSFIVLTIAAMGLGFSMFSSPNMISIMGSVDKSCYSIASALSAKMRNLGMVTSMVIVTTFFSVMIGNKSITQNNIDSFHSAMHYACLCLGVIGLAGIIISFKEFKSKS